VVFSPVLVKATRPGTLMNRPGSRPHRAVLELSSRRVKLGMPVAHGLGTLDCSLLLARFKNCREGRVPQDGGSVPVIWLLCRFKWVSWVRALQEAGSVLLNALNDSTSLLRLVPSHIIESGRGPVRDSCNSSSVT
jgi:hypothetical protein